MKHMSRLSGWFLLCLLTILAGLLHYNAGRTDDAAIRGLLASVDRMDRPILGERTFLRIEARANSFTASKQDAVGLDIDDTGEILVAWQSRRQQEGSYGIYAQRFTKHGKRLGTEMQVNSTTVSHQTGPAISARSKTFVAWQSFGQDGDRAGVFLARLGQSDEIQANIRNRGDQTDVAIVEGEAGGAVLAWIGPDETERQCAWIRVFNAQGHARHAEIAANDTDEEVRSISLETVGDGRCILVWGAADAGIHARLFAADGSPQGPSFKVNREHEVGSIEPSVSARSGQGFLVAWLDNGGTRLNYDVMCRRYLADGMPMEEPQLISRAGTSMQNGVHAAMAADGRACIAWNHAREGLEQTHIKACFAVPGEPFGHSFDLASDQSGHQSLPVAHGGRCMALDNDGRLAIAWSGSAGLGDDTGAHLTLLLPADLATRVTQAEYDPVTVERIREEMAQTRLARMTVATGKDHRFMSELAEPHDPPVFDPKHRNSKTIFDPASGPDNGFAGIANTGWTPPDPHCAAGPAHIVAMTNGAIAWWKKDGSKQFQQTISGGSGFWGGLGATNFVFDPEVVWDPWAKRFWAMACERNPSNGNGSSYFCVAISDNSDPNGTWHKYRLNVTSTAGGGDIDSPNIAIDANAVYLSADFFKSGRRYFIQIMDKTPLLAGNAPGTVKTLRINTSAQSFGMPNQWSAAPAFYMIEHRESSSNNSLVLHAISNPLTTPTRRTISLNVPNYGRPGSVNQRGTSTRLSMFDARFWSCIYRNGSLWAAHHHGSPVKSRWYEITMNGWPTSNQTPTLAQSGDISAPGVSFFFNSIAVDAQSNALMTFARSSANEYVSLQRAYRLASDKPDTMRAPVTIKANTAPYTRASRWGDYSQVAPDPAKGNTLWYTHEYAPSANSWQTWIGSAQMRDYLSADRTTVSASVGGQVKFSLEEPGHANRAYLLLGSASGSKPGFKLPAPPGIIVPLNWDGVTTGILTYITSPAFANFFGVLDANGSATATLTLPQIPPLAGRQLDFAFIQDGKIWDFASNNVSIKLTR